MVAHPLSPTSDIEAAQISGQAWGLIKTRNWQETKELNLPVLQSSIWKIGYYHTWHWKYCAIKGNHLQAKKVLVYFYKKHEAQNLKY